MTGSDRLLATSDCETCRDGWVTQPVNTASSLAYVVAGGALARDARDLPAPDRRQALAVAAAVAAAGLGSVAYHGPGGRLSRWAHDATLVAASGLLAQRDLRVLASRPAPGPLALAAVPLAAAVACGPRTSAPAQALVGGVATSAAVVRRTLRPGPGRVAGDLALAATWAVGATLHLTGRTGGPLCRPRSPFQAHAAWHALSALGLWLGARSADPVPS